MWKRIAFLLLTQLFCVPFARADFIQLSYTARVSSTPDGTKFPASIEISNSGDEAAHDVWIELPSINEKFPVGPIIESKGQATVDVVLEASKIQADKPGEYAVPYRVLYSDAADYKFSAPGVLRLNIPPLPARAVGVLYQGLDEPGLLKVGGHGRFSISLLNVSESPVSISAVHAFSTGEFTVVASEGAMPTQLAPNQKIEISIDVENISAIVGSRYPLYLIVRGDVVDKRYAVTELVYVEVVEKLVTTRASIIVGLAVLGLVVILGYFISKRRTLHSLES